MTPSHHSLSACTALADGVIRCVPGEDHTNGFFVSCFIKKQTLPVGQSHKRKVSEVAEDEAEAAGEEEEVEEGQPENEGVVGSGGTTSNSKKKKKKKSKKQKKGSVSTAAKA